MIKCKQCHVNKHNFCSRELNFLKKSNKFVCIDCLNNNLYKSAGDIDTLNRLKCVWCKKAIRANYTKLQLINVYEYGKPVVSCLKCRSLQINKANSILNT